MSSIKPDQRKDFMDTLRGYMYSDIERAIKIKANYLAALGLSTYTEHLGGLYLGDLSSGNSKKNFTGFIMNFFPGDMYKIADTELAGLGGLYKVVRCGLVHEYFMKTYSTVTISDGVNSKCGVIYDPTHTPQLEFHVDKYYADFNYALKVYYDELTGTTNPAVMATREKCFDKAIENMPFKPFETDSSSTHASGLQVAPVPQL
jgi:hypothetical protein